MKRAFALVVLCLALSGCSREQKDSAVSSQGNAKAQSPDQVAVRASSSNKAEPDFSPLMTAIFGAQYRPATRDALADQANPEDSGGTAQFVVTPVSSTSLESGETVLATNSVVTDDRGKPSFGHVTAGLLSVYFLRPEGKGWKVVGRQENVAALGSSGDIGEVVWVKLGPGMPGLAVLHGGTWQGYTISLLALFDIGGLKVKELTDGSIKVYSTSSGAFEKGQAGYWEVSGDWRLVPSKNGKSPYGDILIDFSGEKTAEAAGSQGKSKGTADSQVTKVAATARYAFDGTAYRLVEGENVVPEF